MYTLQSLYWANTNTNTNTNLHKKKQNMDNVQRMYHINTNLNRERESWSQNENTSDNHGFIMCQMQSWLWFKYNHELATTLLHLKYTYIITDSSYVLSGRETVIWSQNKNNSDKYRSREYIRKKQISMISIVLSNYISISKSKVEKKN